MSLNEIRDRRSQRATLGEMMVLGGKVIFLLMSCFIKWRVEDYSRFSNGCQNIQLIPHNRSNQTLLQ